MNIDGNKMKYATQQRRAVKLLSLNFRPSAASLLK
jgi:hypothetical protein